MNSHINKATCLAVIPARYSSSRFPGKALADINGQSLLQRVFNQVRKAEKVDRLIVATDDARIFDHVTAFGGEALITKNDHINGTERSAEVMELLKEDFDIVINIQGDEPFINPDYISSMIDDLLNNSYNINTLITPIKNSTVLHESSNVKAVIDDQNCAIYFSRAAIPFCRGKEKSEWIRHQNYFKHIGVYGYRSETLKNIAKLRPAGPELAEALEQLRWLYHQYKIHTIIVDHDSPSIDTPDDLRKISNFS